VHRWTADFYLGGTAPGVDIEAQWDANASLSVPAGGGLTGIGKVTKGPTVSVPATTILYVGPDIVGNAGYRTVRPYTATGGTPHMDISLPQPLEIWPGASFRVTYKTVGGTLTISDSASTLIFFTEEPI
jgi:hypothetical protein